MNMNTLPSLVPISRNLSLSGNHFTICGPHCLCSPSIFPAAYQTSLFRYMKLEFVVPMFVHGVTKVVCEVLIIFIC